MFGSKRSIKSMRRKPGNDAQNISQKKKTGEDHDEDDIYDGLFSELGVSGYEIDDDDIEDDDFDDD